MYKVLVLDDENDIVHVFSTFLSEMGFEPLPLTDPQQVINDDSLDFDIALIDYKMPRFSGANVADHIRKIRPDMPIVMMSSVIGRDKRLGSGLHKALDKLDTEHILEKIETIRTFLDSKNMLANHLPDKGMGG